MAAILSLIAFESGDFKYNINHFPGRAGQGTRNMQMPSFNLEYAREVQSDALSKVTAATSTDGLSDDQLNAIRALVLPDEFSFASAAWFLVRKCPNVRTTLQAQGEAGYGQYLSCIGTSITADRMAYYNRALTAFGLPTA